MCNHLLTLSPCSCLDLKGAWGRGQLWMSCCPQDGFVLSASWVPLGSELARHQMGMLFGWWQPADGHHLPWGSSLSSDCYAQLGTGRFLLMRKGEGRGWVAAVLLTLEGSWKTTKQNPRLHCAGDLHPSHSGLACILSFNRRSCLGFCVWRVRTGHKSSWNLMSEDCIKSCYYKELQ